MAANKLRLASFIIKPKLSINRTCNKPQRLLFCTDKSSGEKQIVDNTQNSLSGADKPSEEINPVEDSQSSHLSSDASGGESGENPSRFAEFVDKQSTFLKEKTPDIPQESFASLLKNSKFIDLGNPVGKTVVGTIYLVVGNDLYIDFGWKFPTVCTRPSGPKANLYVEGAKVRLLIKDLELSAKFLGARLETSLHEADCVLLGLAGSNSTRSSAINK